MFNRSYRRRSRGQLLTERGQNFAGLLAVVALLFALCAAAKGLL